MLILSAGLFDDTDMVEAALRAVSDDVSVQQIDLDPRAMTDEDWDGVARLILSAERVVTI